VGFDINQSRVAELKSGIDTLEIDTTTLQKVG
jgi:UDP-N-acetyl-D-mannosaminuronate dehydrogenase